MVCHRIKESFVNFTSFFKYSYPEKFEKKLASFLGVKHVIATSYGRTALYLTLKALKLEDSEVLIPNFTCTVVKQAVRIAGAYPVYVNIRHDTLTLDLNDLESKIGPNTKSILITHYFGSVARNLMDVKKIASKYNLFLIEDCAHSLGASYNGYKVGTFGNVAIFSLTKNLLNLGGGAIATNDNRIYEGVIAFKQNAKTSLANILSDYFALLSYGIEQVITKTVLERPIKVPHKFRLLCLPRVTLKLRKYLYFPLCKLLSTVFRKNTKLYNSNLVPSFSYSQHYHGLQINNFVAAIALRQLKTIDFYLSRRQIIHQMLSQGLTSHYNKATNCNGYQDAFSFFILYNENYSAIKLAKYFKDRRILFKTTWPNRQNFDKYRYTPELTKLKKHMLLLSINPKLSLQDISIIKKHLVSYQKETHGFI